MSELIHTEVRGAVGVLTLNRPRALNALNLEMAVAAKAALDRWATDDRIQAVWWQGAGDRGFCAGGDVRALVQDRRGPDDGQGDAAARAYFEAEYRLDWAMHTFPKPLVVWGHGFVMGGGVGMLLGGSVRVVTPSTRLSMPEVRIGLFPDVGASWFLSRCGGVGAFVGITAAALRAGDAIDLGLADVCLADDDRDDALDALACGSLTGPDAVAGVLAPFVRPSGERAIGDRVSTMHEAVSDGPSAVQAHLSTLASGDDAWLSSAASTALAGCPTSVALTLAQFERAASMSLADVFRQDFDLAVQCFRRPDVFAGVRAVLIDKGPAPAWASVDDTDVGAHFVPPVTPHPLADLQGTPRRR